MSETSNNAAQRALTEPPHGFLIAGIGASAGGVQALREFFAHVPADSGVAYVVILHLSPDHDSQLAEVLQHVAAIPVTQVTEKVDVVPNHVYVVPPDKHLLMDDGCLAVVQNTAIEERRAPVDIFFRTLADSHGPRAIGVILSGTGANGSMGIKRIKERGGAAFVQNPREAEYSEMPRASIATELIDEVLNIALIPAKILAYKDALGTVEIPVEPELRAEEQQQALREIFTELRTRTGHDFSAYKRATLLRRIERRINVRGLQNLPAYAAYMAENPEEAGALLKDLLISVTNFYRDKKSFAALEDDILSEIFSRKRPGDTIRIWSVGCATGEEAYSIAMACAERVSGYMEAPKIQIFASDIDEDAIATAREGLYTLNDAADVPPERLRRFFIKEGDAYRVRRELRETVLFANHNVLRDPPFSHLDLVTCRNMLIYLSSTAQERVLETLHFALDPGGFMFLGSSETADKAGDLFAPFSREHHIYQSRAVAPKPMPVPEGGPSFRFEKKVQEELSHAREEQARSRISFGDLHQQLLEEYAPPSLVVNADFDILHLTARAGRYLQMAGGEPSQNLLKNIRPELRLEVRTALYQAVQHGTAVAAKNLKLRLDDRTETLNVHVRPVTQAGDVAQGFILVVFETVEGADAAESVPEVTLDEQVSRHLEDEIARLKVQLRAAVEHHELQAEELKASNEELQAMNEEMRSAAEELETSKEELQSINEELTTVNQELKVKVEELSMTGSNLRNLINSTAIATVFLDRSLRVAFFTPPARNVFNLIPSDYGRPLSDITNRLEYDGIHDDAEAVLERLAPIEREVRASDGQIFLMRVLPYRTEDDHIAGVVLTFVDITERKTAEVTLARTAARDRFLIKLSDTLRPLADPYAVQHAACRLLGEYLRVDRAYYVEVDDVSGYARVSQDYTRGDSPSLAGRHRIADFGWTIPPYRRGETLVIDDAQTSVRVPDAERPAMDAVRIRAHISVPVLKAGGLVGALCVTEPASREWMESEVEIVRETAERIWAAIDRARAEEAVQRSEVRMQRVLETEAVGVLFFNSDGIVIGANNAFLAMTGYTRNDVDSGILTWQVMTPPEFVAESESQMEILAKTGRIGPYEKEYLMKDGTRRWMLFAGRDLGDGTISEYCIDVTDRVRAEEAVQESEARLRAFITASSDAVYQMSRDWTEMRSLVGRDFIPDTKDPSATWLQTYIHPDDQQRVVEAIREAIATKSPFDFEHRVLRVDGTLGWTHSRAIPLADDAGEITGWFGTARDITERREAEEAIQESRTRLQAVIENLPGGAVFIVDKDLRYVLAEGQALQMTAYKPQDFLGKTVREVMGEHGELQEDNYRRGLKGEAFQSEHQENGHTFISHGIPLRTIDGEVQNVLAVSYDITEQRESAEALRESEERIRIVLEAADLGTWDWDVVADRAIWNDEHYRLYGLVPDGKAKSYEDFAAAVLPEDLPRVAADLMKAVNGPDPYSSEFRIIRANDGALRWMTGYGKAMERDKKGKATRMTGVMYDITARKELEQRKDDFLGVASHELKTPLTSIKAYAEVLGEMLESCEPDAADVVQKLDAGIDRLDRLIHDLLDATRINEGRLELRKESLDLGELCRETAEEMQRTTRTHHIETACDGPTPPVLADRERIRQVFTNIVANAIKYSPDADRVSVRVTAKKKSVQVCVEDFGVGISDEAMARVFERFFREPDPSVQTFPGLGLGLYIAWEIVQSHGGQLTVRSKKGKGSTFCFVLPVGA